MAIELGKACVIIGGAKCRCGVPHDLRKPANPSSRSVTGEEDRERNICANVEVHNPSAGIYGCDTTACPDVRHQHRAKGSGLFFPASNVVDHAAVVELRVIL